MNETLKFDDSKDSSGESMFGARYFCEKCSKPIPEPGLCPSCLEKELRTIRLGNYCDHCHTPATQTRLYINVKTKLRYCDQCRKIFRSELLMRGIPADVADKMIQRDFVPINWNTELKLFRKKRA